MKVLERFPLTESGWADAWSSLVKRDPVSAQAILQGLADRDLAGSLAHRASVLQGPPARFPSSLRKRRAILEAIAKGNEKYARPFDKGKVAIASLLGTESWAEYGSVVLQMAILDTLLSIEEKLGALLEVPEDSGQVQEDSARS